MLGNTNQTEPNQTEPNQTLDRMRLNQLSHAPNCMHFRVQGRVFIRLTSCHQRGWTAFFKMNLELLHNNEGAVQSNWTAQTHGIISQNSFLALNTIPLKGYTTVYLSSGIFFMPLLLPFLYLLLKPGVWAQGVQKPQNENTQLPTQTLSAEDWEENGNME